ncbi:hypothetical protein LPC10_07430 [Methylorubrum sp. B1-46]|uniref:hypothetical protein n=1 Tax=Methylorubrum sp. B1-46 TaxID=2897334 RepID=UPI001E4953F5|nr:hypothetical protein [Methylorubrum sp. B1-46]UGB27389.1 hypothetical protein LPC10_07430 [Methylorubrum sp. B1-46]
MGRAAAAFGRDEHSVKLLSLDALHAAVSAALDACPISSQPRSSSMTVVVLIACNLLLAGLFSLVAVALD